MSRRARIRICVVLLACGSALVAAELLARAFEQAATTGSLHETRLDDTFLYGLRAAHPAISTQRLRDREFDVPKPTGTIRVMLLGDSVVYGVGVELDQTLSRQLERELRKTHPAVEVVNAGVHGWSPWNQRHYFASAGRLLEPDVVVAVFCLNDVADPHLHWRYSQGLIPSIPDAAVPNLEYHREHSVPLLEQERLDQNARQRFPRKWLRRSALYRLAAEFLRTKARRPLRVIDGVQWPLRITGEDSIPIDVLMDRATPEWRWLAEQYVAMQQAVTASDASFVIASVPLAYQLDPRYPYEPQRLLGEFCRSIGVTYAPALPRLVGREVDAMFLGRRSGYDDIWHLTAEGLAVVAEGLAEHLRQHVLL